MDNSKRKILFGLYALMGLTIEGFILWLFPFTGLGGLICWPTAIIFSLGFGFILFKLTKRQLKPWQTLIAFLILITFQSHVQLSTIPQDSGGDAFSKISDAKSAFSKYDQIEFNDFPSLTTGERVAYLYKFKSKLPDTFISLTIDSLKNEYESTNPRTYLIQNIDGKRQYDESKIKIAESDTATIITEYYNKTDTLVYKMDRNFINIGSGGYNDRILSLDIHEDDFKLDTGIEILLYTILGWTKKAYR
jgi:hypothetical protein